MQRLLIWVADASEIGNLSGDGFLVEALDIALDERVQRSPREHFHKPWSLCAKFVAYLAIWRDRRRDSDSAAGRDEPGPIADTPDVGITVFFRESQPLREVCPNLIAIEQLNLPSARLELGPQRIGDGRLAGTRQSREPHDESSCHAS